MEAEITTSRIVMQEVGPTQGNETSKVSWPDLPSFLKPLKPEQSLLARKSPWSTQSSFSGPLVSSTHPTKRVIQPTKTSSISKKAVKKERPKPKWMRDVPEGEFDEHVHGYWRAADGTYPYRHQDGRVLRNCTGCDEI